MKTFAAECPYCGCTFQAQESYLGKKGRCSKCGESFVVHRPASKPAANEDLKLSLPEQPPVPIKPPEEISYAGQEQSPIVETQNKQTFSISHNFSTLKILSMIYGVMGALVLVLGVCIGLYLFATSIAVEDPSPTGLMMIPPSVLLGTTLLVTRELINVALAVEENTRITAETVNELRK